MSRIHSVGHGGELRHNHRFRWWRDGNILGELSGGLADQSVTSFTSSSSAIFLEFISDESISARGFEFLHL